VNFLWHLSHTAMSLPVKTVDFELDWRPLGEGNPNVNLSQDQRLRKALDHQMAALCNGLV
jgi:hypothetical protein